VDALFADPENLHTRIFERMLHFLAVRETQAAFDPYGEQQVLALDERIFALRRTSRDAESRILALVNVSSESFDLILEVGPEVWDLISGERLSVEEGQAVVHFSPYRAVWLKI
jgi:sucrose phosphorylase